MACWQQLQHGDLIEEQVVQEIIEKFYKQDLRNDTEKLRQKEAEQASSINVESEAVTKAEKPDEDVLDKMEVIDAEILEADGPTEEVVDNSSNNMKLVPFIDAEDLIISKNPHAEQAKGCLLSIDDETCDVNENHTETQNNDRNADVALVYLTASLKNCTHSTVDSMTLDTISEILRSKEHLRNNLKSSIFGNIRNRPMYLGSSKFMHEVEVSVEVFKSRLWESARSYL